MPSTPQGFGLPAQYRQVPQYSQGHTPVTFNAPEAPQFQQQFSSSGLYHGQHLSVPDTFPPTHSQSHSPPAQQLQPGHSMSFSQPAGHQNSMSEYTLPLGFGDESSGNPPRQVNLSEVSTATDISGIVGIPGASGLAGLRGLPGVSGVSDQSAMNPLFFGTPQLADNSHNHSIYVNPSDFDRPEDSRPFDYFRNDLQFVVPAANNRPIPAANHQPTPAPNHQPPPAANNQPTPAATSSMGVTPSVMHGHPRLPPAPPKRLLDARKKKKPRKPKRRNAAIPSPLASIEEEVEEDSVSDDESDESDLEIVEPEEPSPIPSARPTQPESRVEYDTLQIVWFPRNRQPEADKVRSALDGYKELVKSIRDKLRADTQALKRTEQLRAERASSPGQVLSNHALLCGAQLEMESAENQRRYMDIVVTTTLDKGHPLIVEKLGEHPMIVASLYSFLLDQHQASKMNCPLTVNILKLLSRFVTMDEDVLSKTNIAKLLSRYVKKGSPVVKELAQKVLDNAAARTEQKQETAKSSTKSGSPTKSATPAGTEQAGSKQSRESESDGQPATKRTVVTSQAKNVPRAPSNAPSNGPAKRPEAGPADKPPTAARTQKAQVVAPKVTNLFGTLSSASKRPGTSNAERAAAAAAKTNAGPNKKRRAVPNSCPPPFSLGDIMAGLSKPKDPSPEEPAEDTPPETEEEREQRLRKEARRKLRVSWKSDSELTEVRFFTHDPEEELGPGDRSRDVGDLRGEGSALKLHRDLELDEDDDASLREENMLDYFEPSEIDYTGIGLEDQARNFFKRGGTQQPTSQENKAQEHREANTLMEIYAPGDVPPSPKEPPLPSDDEPAVEVVPFGEVPDHIKARSERYYSIVHPKPPIPAQTNTPSAPIDIPNLLRMLGGQQQQSTPPPPPQPAQTAMSDLERTVSMLSQQPPQASQQQPAPVMPMPQFTPDMQAMFAIMNAQQQAQPALQPQVPPPQQPSIPPNLAAIISQFTGQNQQNGVNSYQTHGLHEDPERKRMRETAFDGTDDERYSKRNKPNPPNKQHPKVGLVPCRYWASGKCRKGSDCTYRHDPS
ncbi:uncharacterized protein BDW47DRAFT_120038 [Aspergillus candidus]|uniref:C3H1-type domain-containing protein n=1 Tax=Aspergillus candidus TaxID=41067 RepID=A0A2I2F2D1_ASPCN|nr:hypothetical protein BDW47DRAFT_120038 [Aspergillus candidus]PLB34790.1 hypothetical protein BDW47DRAFT_120038 [Aspergillus candidus]